MRRSFKRKPRSKRLRPPNRPPNEPDLLPRPRFVFSHSRAPVGGVRRYQMADPAEHAAAAEPEARRHDQPENAAQKVAVVNLTDAGNDERKHSGGTGSVHGDFGFSMRTPPSTIWPFS